MTLNRRTSRAAVALAAALPLLLAGCGSVDSAPVSSDTTAISAHVTSEHDQLDAVLRDLENSASTRIGLAALNTVTGESYGHRADESFAMCSTFKTYAAAQVLRLEEAGETSLDKEIMIDPAKIVEYSPVTEPAAGTTMTLAELADAALTRSDNTAGNYLLEEIGGPPAVTAIARDMGDDSTRLDRWEPELNEALRGDPRDTSTPGELADGYQELLLGDGLTDADREQLVAWMRGSTTSDERIRAGLPSGWTAADKTGGGYFGTNNNAGVVWTPEGDPIVLVFLTDSSTGLPDAKANNSVIAKSTAAVIKALG